MGSIVADEEMKLKIQLMPSSGHSRLLFIREKQQHQSIFDLAKRSTDNDNNERRKAYWNAAVMFFCYSMKTRRHTYTHIRKLIRRGDAVVC